MINFSDLQEAMLIAYAQPIEQVAVFAVLLLVVLAVTLMAWIATQRVTRI